MGDGRDRRWSWSAAELEASGDLDTARFTRHLAEVRAARRAEEPHMPCVLRALGAILVVARAERVPTVGLLMARCGVGTLPDLLDAIGFTGDAGPLAGESAGCAAASPARGDRHASDTS